MSIEIIEGVVIVDTGEQKYGLEPDLFWDVYAMIDQQLGWEPSMLKMQHFWAARPSIEDRWVDIIHYFLEHREEVEETLNRI